MRPSHKALLTCAALTALAAASACAPARAVAPLPPQFEGVDVENKLGQRVMGDVPFTSTSAATTSLGAFLDDYTARAGEPESQPDGRPVLLTLNYYRCTSLCSQQLNALLLTLQKLGWAPGAEKFRIVTVSFDPSDDVATAAGKQETYRKELARLLAEEREEELSEAELDARAQAIDWSFLVGDDRSIRTLTKNLGYTFRYDEATRQYAHSPVVYVLSSKGIITRYLWGLELPARDLEFALVEAGNGVLGSFGTKVLLSCFVFEDGKYHAFAWGFMRIGASLVALVLGVWLFVWWRREKRKRLAPTGSAGPGGPAAALRGQGV